ncbi:MAG: hypothetical protein R3283_11040, partial [Balneolaceae bacterium]|nr:hypothetical protein [Balneolaceae bacterium]
YGMAYWMRYLSAPDYRDDIQSEFLREWSGEPEDEYYAWIRLRNRYRKRDSLPKHLHYIQGKIDHADMRQMLSGSSVDEFGIVDFHSPTGQSSMNRE